MNARKHSYKRTSASKEATILKIHKILQILLQTIPPSLVNTRKTLVNARASLAQALTSCLRPIRQLFASITPTTGPPIPPLWDVRLLQSTIARPTTVVYYPPNHRRCPSRSTPSRKFVQLSIFPTSMSPLPTPLHNCGGNELGYPGSLYQQQEKKPWQKLVGRSSSKDRISKSANIPCTTLNRAKCSCARNWPVSAERTCTTGRTA